MSNHGERSWEGEWKVEPPKPSPGPWTVKSVRDDSPYARTRDRIYLVMDKNGACVAECDREVDARFIAENGPRS